ncbi:hypothetical protein [Chthonobacter albigriseus]|uniref:hypothetical protein n=1 Tax=Chthonobacter albigriseus TaxID=1683161 RepID=UPI0015EF458E|nr:hypothetical protein [Chthonobacter albigriseus]
MRRDKRSVLILSVVLLTTLATFAATAFAVVGVSALITRDDPNAFLERLYTETEQTVRAAIDPRFQTKSTEVGRVTNRLVMMEILKGGAMFDATGHLVESFGEKAVTGFEAIKHGTSRIFRTLDPYRVEFYIPPEVSGTPFHLIARIEITEMTRLETISGERVTMLALASGALAAVIIAIVVWLRVARPMRQILAVVDRVISDPASADAAMILPTGRDEIGALGIALDRFRTMLASTWRSKVIVAENLLERAPVGVVQLAMEGTPTFCNSVATALFDRDVVKTQNTAPLVVRDLASGERAVIREHLEKHGSECRLVEIMTSSGPRYAMCGGLVIGRDTRSPSYLVLFTDISPLYEGKVAAEDARQRAEYGTRTTNRRNMELKLSLEACLSLLGGGEKHPEVHIEVLPFVEEWLAMARQSDLVVNSSIGNESPIIAGPQEELRAVIRLGLLLAYARTGSAPAAMVIEGRGINFETAGFTIRAQAAGGDGGPEHAVAADWQLIMAAFRTALRKVGGQISEFTAGEDGTTVKFVLRGAAERMQTAIKAATR